MVKFPMMKRRKVVRRLEDLGARFVREGGDHEVWRCGCGRHQTAVPRHGLVSSFVIHQIGRQMPCLGKEWWL